VAYSTAFTSQAGVPYPIICGPMYPCSNPELVAAASAAGAMAVVQPVSMTYVFGHDLRTGLRQIRQASTHPIGMNLLIEESSPAYRARLEKWLGVALEEGVRFFITSLGNPRWVVDRVRGSGGIVYHDATESKWAAKAVQGGVHGLIAVNNVAGGHPGPRSPESLLNELKPFGLPLICAGGIGDPAAFRRMMDLGYDGAQMGTRFIATTECLAHQDYKDAIVRARPEEVVLTERLTGVPVAVLNNEYIQRLGTRVGPFGRWMFRGRRTKRWIRTLYALRSAARLKKSSLSGRGAMEYWQAGKSVEGIKEILPAGEVVRQFAAALD
jgi:nitronate monooxygenase